MKKRFYLLAALFAGAGTPYSKADDLLSIYKQALSSDVQLSSAVAALKATQEVVPQSRANLLPNVNLTATDTNNTRDTHGTSEQDYGSHSYNFKLTQPLFNAADWFQLSAAHAQYDQAEAQIAAAEQDLIIRVADAYFGVLAAQDTLAASKAQEVAMQNQLEQATQKFKVGLIAITDQYEAQAAYDLARAERITNDSELAIAYQALTTLTTKNYDHLSILQDKLPIVKTTPANIDDWLKTAFATNPDLKAAVSAAQASEKKLNQARSGHLPTIELFANKLYNNTGSDTSVISEQTNQEVVGVEFNMPIFEGGATQSKVREASYNKIASQDRAEFTRRVLTQQVTNFFDVVNNDVEKIEARKQARLSAASALEATQAGYDVGTRDIVEVLQVSKTKFAAERDYAISRYDYILNTLRLKQAAGTLSENDIKELNQWLTDNVPGSKKEDEKQTDTKETSKK